MVSQDTCLKVLNCLVSLGQQSAYIRRRALIRTQKSLITAFVVHTIFPFNLEYERAIFEKESKQ